MQMPPIGNVTHSPTRAADTVAHVAEHAAAIAPVHTASTDAADKKPDAAPPPALPEAIQNINKTMLALGQDLEFSIDPDSDRTIVKVIDHRTKDVIRQMPSAEALEIAKALDRVQGLLIRQKA